MPEKITAGVVDRAPEIILEEDPSSSLEGIDEDSINTIADTGVSKEPVILQKNDRSLAEFERWYKNGRLIIDPEWQRGYVWDKRRASRLIESFLKDIPIPVVYLSQREDGKYEVIDGLQRLTSVFDFFNNSYKLSSLELFPELTNKYYKDLPDALQAKLQDATLRTFELAPQTPKSMMFAIFERLNTGGVALNEMEIRNCIFNGKLLQIVKELSENKDFIKAINTSTLSNRMMDRNLVLRFLAFYERHYTKCKQGLKKFLNTFCEEYRNINDGKSQEFRQKFNHSMKAASTIFGDEGFRLRKETSSRLGGWASRVNASVFQVLTVSFTDFPLEQLTRRRDAIEEAYIDLVSSPESKMWVDYAKTSTGDYARIDYLFSIWNQRLREAIGDCQANDPNRCFSAELKKQLYKDQDKTCAICKQKIPLLIDAEVDHIEHYWKGGKTIPENARLVHRHCNRTRSHEK